MVQFFTTTDFSKIVLHILIIFTTNYNIEYSDTFKCLYIYDVVIIYQSLPVKDLGTGSFIFVHYLW